MIDAIGTVIFWTIAAGLAWLALFFGMLLLAGICAVIAAPFQAIGQWAEQRAQRPVNRHLRAMTPEQRHQWANRIGPYANI